MTASSNPATVGEDCEFVNVLQDDQVTTVELDRPEAKNALNSAFRAELREVLKAADADTETRVIVLTGSSEAGAFCAGGDVTELRERDGIQQLERIEKKRIFHRVYELATPVIAFVNGAAIGGGCELAQACDIRIATADTAFGQPETDIGLFPGAGGTQWLTRLVGRGQASRLILAGERIDGKEAERIGLIEEAHADAEAAADRVYELAAAIAEKSPLGVKFAKKAIKLSERTGVDTGLDHEALLYAHLFNTEDKNEGIDAFLQKREPEWQGR